MDSKNVSFLFKLKKQTFHHTRRITPKRVNGVHLCDTAKVTQLLCVDVAAVTSRLKHLRLRV